MNTTTKEKLLSALAEKGITPGCSYEHNILTEKYIDIEEVFLREIFAEDYCNNMNMRNLIAHLNDVAEQRDLADNLTYKSVINELSNLSELIGGLINGSKGEVFVGNALDGLHDYNRILRNVYLDTPKGKREYDFIVITKKGLFIIEVKHSKSPTIVDSLGNFRKVGGHQSHHYNIANALSEKEYVLFNSLTPELQAILPRERIHSVMVIVGNTDVDNHCKGLNICSHGTIYRFIDKFRTDEHELFRTEIDELFNYVESCKTKAYFPIGIDVERYCADFADLVGLIDDAVHNYDVFDDIGDEPERDDDEFEQYESVVTPEAIPIKETADPKPKYFGVAAVSVAAGFALAHLPKLIKILKNFR